MRGRPQGVGDLVVGHGAVDVVGPVPERHLGHRRRDHDPEGLDVGEVVQEEACHGDLPQVGVAGGDGKMRQLRPAGVEGQGHEAHEPAGLILQLPDVEQVADLLLLRLDVSVEERGVATGCRRRGPRGPRRTSPGCPAWRGTAPRGRDR